MTFSSTLFKDYLMSHKKQSRVPHVTSGEYILEVIH